MTEEDRAPDIYGFQRAQSLDGEAETDRHHDLRDERDIERAPRIAGPL
jgi:hypothetical protein